MGRFPILWGCAALAACSPLAVVPQLRTQLKPAPTAIRLVTPPLVNYAPLLVARDKGWFGEEFLSVSWQAVAQTAVAIEAVYGGSAEFGGGGVLEPMVARGNGLDLMFAVPTARVHRAAPDNSRPGGASINHVHFAE